MQNLNVLYRKLQYLSCFQLKKLFPPIYRKRSLPASGQKVGNPMYFCGQPPAFWHASSRQPAK